MGRQKEKPEFFKFTLKEDPKDGKIISKSDYRLRNRGTVIALKELNRLTQELLEIADDE